MRRTLYGAIVGLAWGVALRAWMAALAGDASRYTLTGTGLGVLLPSTLVGASFGLAEEARRAGDGRVRRWAAASPLLFVAMPALVQPDFIEQLKTGLGTGAIGVALIGMLGGYAISGRGPAWARTTSRVTLALLLLAAIVGSLVGGSEQQSRAPSYTNLLLALSLIALLALLSWGCAIPHRALEQEPAQ